MKSKAGLKIIVGGEKRLGKCEDCGTKTKVVIVDEDGRKKERALCPKCGGEGKLIVRFLSVESPKLPQCLNFKGVMVFIKDAITSALIARYHAKRMVYAQKNWDKKILERYRTGEPSPETLWQAIHANIKLQCPVCRRYNRDPLLFRRN